MHLGVVDLERRGLNDDMTGFGLSAPEFSL